MTEPVIVNGVEITRTARGFRVYGDPITPRVYNHTSVQVVDSSIAFEGPHCWVTIDQQAQGNSPAHTTSIQLSTDEAQALRDRLDAFLDQRDPDRLGLRRVDMWQAKCTGCGYIETEYGDYSGWGDENTPIESLTDDGDWFKREVVTRVIPADDSYPYERKVYQLVELLCLECVAKAVCEVCGEAHAYPVDGHLVCEDHEDHDFE
ncbi:hypothetical protein SEA_MORGANA_87 [Gordonia phage Morgana]|uniref:Uncharacterized protein n=1 Tax=Gordonia phage Morgana TaxID=3137292 RepID=A0AAX4RAS8_9CAUD